MRTLLSRLRPLALFAKEVEPTRKSKSAPAVVPPSSEAIEAERIAKLYLEFEAIPSDPLHLIQQRFIRKKKLLGSRKVYIPNVLVPNPEAIVHA